MHFRVLVTVFALVAMARAFDASNTCYANDFTWLNSSHCKMARVTLRDFDVVENFDWRFLDALLIVGHNATIVGRQHKLPMRVSTAYGVTFDGLGSEEPLFVQSQSMDRFVVESCTLVETHIGTITIARTCHPWQKGRSH